MLRILLCCSAGMSTSMLVSKMQAAARRESFECKIEAMSIAQAKMELDKWDVVMVGPQMGFAVKELQAVTDKPVEVIPPQIYAVAKGPDAIKMAQDMAKKAGLSF
ncbi:PTS system, cellobiose-specific IIB component [Spiroplasma helicoides]|uniref:PTS system, cellobiose-specific IIB component n=1 Tax=Spiroplasma helicoides TaxID=216938 RepID=A0A1B3SJP4_9MOLU|nr:PTS sugar transporter subunit IIB [Spiroplasma helicoides]AOG60147.1 PTS system, cellobiose-specific IIB component [Spiroplasma helicoides]